MVKIEINPNLRFSDGTTCVSRDNIPDVVLTAGQQVQVYERVSKIEGTATVQFFDYYDVILLVDWEGLRING